MVSCLLGYPSDQWVDEVILAFLSVFSAGDKPSLIFNYSQFLAESIHDQFLKFSIEGAFKHQTDLVYLSLFFQADRFKFPLQKVDAQGTPQSVIHWTSLVRKNTKEYSFSDYVNQFLHTTLFFLSSDIIPRISLEIKRILHLSEQSKIRDWYLY